MCHSSYIDACIPPRAGDVDCPDGSGDGPTCAPTTDFRVVGPDVFGLDRDNDGIACETAGSDAVSDGVTAAAVGPSPTAGAGVVSQRALARTGEGSGRQVQLAFVLVLFGLALVIAPGVLLAQKRRMD